MREKIIDTAIEEFTRNGLKFTMNDVAKALGISKKTIYTVYPDKEAQLTSGFHEIEDIFDGEFLCFQDLAGGLVGFLNKDLAEDRRLLVLI